MTLKGYLTTSVSQSASSGSTLFGLPGSGGAHASYSDVNLTVYTAIYDDGSVYVGLNGSITDTVLSSDYPVKLCINPESWTWSYTGGALTGGGDGAFTATINVGSGGSFVWSFTCAAPGETAAGSGYVKVGSISEFHGSTTGTDGYLYIGGTGTYSVDEPIYPVPMRISIPGFIEYIEYYPWASYGTQDGTAEFISCEYSGSVKQYESQTWQDKKNTNDTGTVHYYNGSEWEISPKIGYPYTEEN